VTRTRKLLVGSAAAAILVALVVTDRMAAAALEQRLAERLRCATGAANAPKVRVDGFPVLTQLAAGHLDRIEVTADDVPLATATVTHVRARATRVELSGGTVTARSVSIFATISYADLAAYQAAAPDPDVPIVGGNEDDQLILRTEVVVDERSEPATVHADVSVLGNWLIIAPDRNAPPAPLPPQTALGRAPMPEVPPRSLKMPALPPGLKYRAAGGAPDGLQLMASGGKVRVPACD
jgi:hypothetical protein